MRSKKCGVDPKEDPRSSVSLPAPPALAPAPSAASWASIFGNKHCTASQKLHRHIEIACLCGAHLQIYLAKISTALPRHIVGVRARVYRALSTRGRKAAPPRIASLGGDRLWERETRDRFFTLPSRRDRDNDRYAIALLDLEESPIYTVET